MLIGTGFISDNKELDITNSNTCKYVLAKHAGRMFQYSKVNENRVSISVTTCLVYVKAFIVMYKYGFIV